MLYFTRTAAGLLVMLSIVLTGCNDDDPVGPDPSEDVSFSQHVLPIFQQHGCTDCHGATLQENNLRVDSVERLLIGGDQLGPAVIPGNAEESPLIRQMSANPPLGNRMPLGMSPVPESQQNTIRDWINEGAEDN